MSRPTNKKTSKKKTSKMQLPAFVTQKKLQTSPSTESIEAPQNHQEEPSHQDDFIFLEKLAQGGMGVIFRGKQRSLERDVVLKVCRKADEESFQFLRKEAKITGKLEHPNIVPLHMLSVDDKGNPMIVMKKVDGLPWTTYIKQPEKITQDFQESDHLKWHINVFIQLCNALSFAHARDVIHLDIKPENVMIGLYGEVYLLDWGISVDLQAKEEDVQESFGTLGFLPPEMLVNTLDDLDQRTDVYLLGSTLHYVLTGQYRHAGKEQKDILLSTLKSEPVTYPPGIPLFLANICNKATAAKKEDRFQTVANFQMTLREYLQQQTSFTLLQQGQALLQQCAQTLEQKAQPIKRQFDELYYETRYTFQNAIRLWPENTQAIHDLQKLFCLVLEYQLAIGSLEEAKSTLALIESPSSLQQENVEKLEQEQKLQALKVSLYDKEQLEQDFLSAFRERKYSFIFVVGCVMAVLLPYSKLFGEHSMNYNILLKTYGLATILIFSISLFFHKRLTTNEFNRTIYRLLWSVILFADIITFGFWLSDMSVHYSLLMAPIFLSIFFLYYVANLHKVYSSLVIIGIVYYFIGAFFLSYVIEVLLLYYLTLLPAYNYSMNTYARFHQEKQKVVIENEGNVLGV